MEITKTRTVCGMVDFCGLCRALPFWWMWENLIQAVKLFLMPNVSVEDSNQVMCKSGWWAWLLWDLLMYQKIKYWGIPCNSDRIGFWLQGFIVKNICPGTERSWGIVKTQSSIVSLMWGGNGLFLSAVWLQCHVAAYLQSLRMQSSAREIATVGQNEILTN